MDRIVDDTNRRIARRMKRFRARETTRASERKLMAGALGACRSETAADAATEDPRRGIFRPIGLVVRQEIAELSRKIVA